MDGSGTHKVKGDPGNLYDSPASVEGGQASHAPPTNEPVRPEKILIFSKRAKS